MSDETTFKDAATGDPALPGDPFVRLRYHYGMLLGAEDFSVEQREKVLRRRLHQALLHGAGTAWGLRVVQGKGDEGSYTILKVLPGFAVDALGRDIYVDQEQCLDLSGLARSAAWSELESLHVGESSRRRAYILLRYEACQSQPVPAITPPCNEPGDAVVYSRLLDRFRIDLAAERPPDPYALQRDWLAHLRAADPKSSPRDILLEFLLNPPASLAALWGRPSDAPLLLATIDLVEEGAGDQRKVVIVQEENNPNNAVRALLPSVQLVAESLFGERLMGAALPTHSTSVPFQVVSWSLTQPGEIRVGLSAVPHPHLLNSVNSDSPIVAFHKPSSFITLKHLDKSGWAALQTRASWDAKTHEIVIQFDSGGHIPQPTTYHLHIVGESGDPLISADGRPLAGILGDPLTHPQRGRDVSIIIDTSHKKIGPLDEPARRPR